MSIHRAAALWGLSLGLFAATSCARRATDEVSGGTVESTFRPMEPGGHQLTSGRWHAEFTLTECWAPCRRPLTVSGTFHIATRRHTIRFDSLLGHGLDPDLSGWSRGDSLFFHLGPSASHGWVGVSAVRVGRDAAHGRWFESSYVTTTAGTVRLRRLQ